jgi:hypothetical protein
MYASVAILDKKTGVLRTQIDANIALENLQLASDEILSWDAHYQSVSPKFDWNNRIMRYGNAVARVAPTKGGETKQIPHIDIRIEGDPRDVYHLIEEVTRLLGGEVINCEPMARSWWKRFAVWCRQVKLEMDTHYAG